MFLLSTLFHFGHLQTESDVQKLIGQQNNNFPTR